jgi:hypothetical protein
MIDRMRAAIVAYLEGALELAELVGDKKLADLIKRALAEVVRQECDEPEGERGRAH